MMRRNAMRSGAAWVLVTAMLALGAGSAAAQGAADYPACNKKASPSDLEAAKGAHKAASELYDRGDFDKAIQYWRDAYNFDCSAHALLINIANAYQKKGDRLGEIGALEVYVAREAKPKPDIPPRLAELKKQQANAPPPTAAPTTTAAPATTATAPPAADTGERPFGITPWIVAGSGAAVLLVGVILTPIGYSSISNAELLCPTHENCSEEAASKGNTGRLEVGIGWVGIGVGALALGGGLAWQFLFNKPKPAAAGAGPDKARAVRVLPMAGPNGAGLTAIGSF